MFSIYFLFLYTVIRVFDVGGWKEYYKIIKKEELVLRWMIDRVELWAHTSC